MAGPEPEPFEIDAAGVPLAGEAMGKGPPVVLLHGITATRRYVLHGSNALVRRGFRQVAYDARAHGESGPAPGGKGYGYPELGADLAAVVAARVEGTPVLAGHSMGCHTAVSYALEHPGNVAGLVLIGPVSLGLPPPEETLEYWDSLAGGLADDGIDGFMRAYEAALGVAADWRETALRITRERMERHRNPAALAAALRELPRSVPFDGMAELESLDVPALVVASHDEADPAHPYSIAEAWSEALPAARLTSEERGKSPLAWQGGRLAREIAAFCEEDRVAERHGRRPG